MWRTALWHSGSLARGEEETAEDRSGRCLGGDGREVIGLWFVKFFFWGGGEACVGF